MATFGGDGTLPVIEAESHPYVIIAHLTTKIGAIALFIVLRWVIEGILSSGSCDSFCSGLSFVIIFLLAVDFWVTKNVSGRFLVGLRWWNEILPEGGERWIFESNEGKRSYKSSETMIFWGSLFGATLFWGVICLLALISLNFTTFFITGVGMLLNGVNLVGYIKCARKAREEVKGQIQSYAISTAMSSGTTQHGDSDDDDSDDSDYE
eukprot:CAMPEP_0201522450 /NCGR_PEP_ID=MMETSP0161_2-20130828/17492_1 /ASSEMBLY_ACC=CAM_ASM_000251 /TAXON_ID=180227 /ORGANISM="Neoparamoeba aestuarina, Strain SoJaBio B1-5/56/2" /LENGTH=207 /DNA_ID=CAMNT_0047921297 /DNA_START=65 /DNA_END=688 /DNA_ORIENTATION=-